jgi:hypothetical protein
MSDPVIGAAAYLLERVGKASGRAVVVQATEVGKPVGLSRLDIVRRAPEICNRIQTAGLAAEFDGSAFRISRPLVDRSIEECLEEYNKTGDWKVVLNSKTDLTEDDRGAIDAQVRERLGKKPKPWPRD